MSAPADPASPPALTGAVGILLAAGAGHRMGRPKALVVGDDGEPWLVRGIRALQDSGCAHVVVVLGAEAARARALLATAATRASQSAGGGAVAHSGGVADSSHRVGPPDGSDAAGALGGVRIVEAPDWPEGIGASLRAGLAEADPLSRTDGADHAGHADRHSRTDGADHASHADRHSRTDGTDHADHADHPSHVETPPPAGPASGHDPRFAIVTLVDLPELRPDAIRRVASGATETTLRQATYSGRPGHPVVIGAAHFTALRASLHGDVGARPYLRAHGVEAVDCTDLGGGDDVDTPPLRAG
ncbi:NTP transferase domain-containing protein [Herbiconiux sp. UC225_62]|uniref:nucleotidyltransferase family protein n=1 Tax=Herbiconiux sp. UC225_62 TaxID=3350168 RepID=UPI0036D20A34